MSVTIDASVWIAAADPTDCFHQISRAFLRCVMGRQINVVEPSYAMVEVACALARRLRSTSKGRVLARGLMDPTIIQAWPVDNLLLSETEETGTRLFLRAADALYPAVAVMTKVRLFHGMTSISNGQLA